MNKKVIIFGTGEAGRQVYNDLFRNNDTSVITFTDNDPNKQGETFMSLPIITPSQIKNEPFDLIIVASMHFREISHQLTNEIKIPEDRIGYTASAFAAIAGEWCDAGLIEKAIHAANISAQLYGTKGAALICNHIAQKTGDADLAVKVYRDISTEYHDEAQAGDYATVARIYRATGQYRKAMKAVAQGLKLFPEDGALLRESAETDIAQKRWKRAADKFRRLQKVADVSELPEIEKRLKLAQSYKNTQPCAIIRSRPSNPVLARFVNIWRKTTYRLSPYKRYCPACGIRCRAFESWQPTELTNREMFFSSGRKPTPDILCPICHSHARHRFMWWFIQTQTTITFPPSKQILHIAAWKRFEQVLSKIHGDGYFTGGLSPNFKVRMDITNIPFDDHSFDVILCSHVLEHVQDDCQAMREMVRVLKPSGWALIIVPIQDRQITIEDATITDPLLRAKVFGQADHVRKYGLDIVNRLNANGFSTRIVRPQHYFFPEDIKRMQIHQQDMFLCSINGAT